MVIQEDNPHESDYPQRIQNKNWHLRISKDNGVMSPKYKAPLNQRCEIKGCGNEYGLIYLKRRICNWHWDALAAEGVPKEELYEALNVPKRLRDGYVDPRLRDKKDNSDA
jgi:hypothetical protein